MRRAAAAGLAAAMLVPGATAADGRDGARTSATPGADYGGGNIPGDYRRRHTRTVLLSFAVSADGARARALVYPAARCGTRAFTATVSLAPDGSFSATGVSRRLPGGSPSNRRLRSIVRYRLEGRLEGQSGSGRLSGRMTFRPRGERPASCSMSSDWQVRTARTAGPAAPPVAGSQYYGTTGNRVAGQPGPFVMRVSADGRRMPFASVVVSRRCRVKIEDAFIGYHFPGTSVAPDGSFRSRERYTHRYSNARERYLATAGGTITGSTATGTLSVASTIRFQNGRTGRCRTGQVSWSAST